MKQVSIIAIIVAALLSGCGRKGTAAPEAGQSTVKIGANDYVVAKRQRITTGPTLSGTLAAQTEANVRAELAGPLLDVKVKEGDRVAKGQLLARISKGAVSAQQSAQQSAISNLRSNVALAERELARQQSLYKAGIVAKAQVDAARGQLDAARAQVAQAQGQSAATTEQARDATVESPIDGIVSKRWVSEGDVVQPGTTLFTIIDPQTLQLEAAVSPDNLQDIRPGTPIEFRIQGIEGKLYTGRIARINPTADPTTRQIHVFAELPNPGGTLVGGLFAEGRVRNMSRIGVVVPSAAIDHRMTTPAVTRVANGVVQHFSVVLGVVDDENDQTEIRQGVQAGDVLLVGASQQIAAGTRVELPTGAQQQAGSVAP